MIQNVQVATRVVWKHHQVGGASDFNPWQSEVFSGCPTPRPQGIRRRDPERVQETNLSSYNTMRAHPGISSSKNSHTKFMSTPDRFTMRLQSLAENHPRLGSEHLVPRFAQYIVDHGGRGPGDSRASHGLDLTFLDDSTVLDTVETCINRLLDRIRHAGVHGDSTAGVVNDQRSLPQRFQGEVDSDPTLVVKEVADHLHPVSRAGQLLKSGRCQVGIVHFASQPGEVPSRRSQKSSSGYHRW